MRVSRLRQSGELVVDLDDACIPDLPGVRFACCGHGHERAYLVLTDGTKLLGDDALALMRRLGGSPPDPREEESS